MRRRTDHLIDLLLQETKVHLKRHRPLATIVPRQASAFPVSADELCKATDTAQHTV